MGVPHLHSNLHKPTLRSHMQRRRCRRRCTHTRMVHQTQRQTPRTMRVCSVTGCPTLYPSTQGTRCPAHRKEARQSRYETNNVYSSKGHKHFRSEVLTRDPICVLCQLKQATVADHYPHSRKELIEQGLNPNDPIYGRGLCPTCHNSETARLQPGGWNDRQG